MLSTIQKSVSAWFGSINPVGYTKYTSKAETITTYPCVYCEDIDQTGYAQSASLNSTLQSINIVFSMIAKVGKDNLKASLTTAFAGDNNDIIFTCTTSGDSGNLIKIKFIAGLTESISYSRSVYAIQFIENVSTANSIILAFNAYTNNTGVIASLSSGSTGTGFVLAMVETAFTGGVTSGLLAAKDKLQYDWQTIFSTAKAKIETCRYEKLVHDGFEIIVLYASAIIPKI